MLLAPRHEVAILHERGGDQLSGHGVDRVPDEARIEHERVAIRFLQMTQVAHGPDTIRARFDDRHRALRLAADEPRGPRGSDPTDSSGLGSLPRGKSPTV